jgi:hypothetical protein
MIGTGNLGHIWLDRLYWKRLNRIERHHQRIQSEHETWRRSFDRSRAILNADLRLAWERYCEVIAELARTTGELEMLRQNLSAALSEANHESVFAARTR